MPTLLQINVTANWGSTGIIAEQISQKVLEKGWKSYIAYGRYASPCKTTLFKINTQFGVYEHYAENRLFDNEGLTSRKATRKLVAFIEKVKPDIIHLHNIHDHYLNYKILFEKLQTLNIPIVWTQHDCWAFTGGCAYYSRVDCQQWRTECIDCPQKRGLLLDKTQLQFNLKKRLFCGLANLTLIPVSEWLAGEISKSFLSTVKSKTIINGIDINTFKYVDASEKRKSYNLGDGPILLGVAAVWDARKGLKDYIQLASKLKNGEKIVLVGISEKQAKLLPQNIVPIARTQNVQELVGLYSVADIVLNLSYEETFGLTIVEGFACGTPGIVYDKTASPELMRHETGCIVTAGNIDGVYNAVQEILYKGKESFSDACRKHAENFYNKDNSFAKYYELYNELL